MATLSKLDISGFRGRTRIYEWRAINLLLGPNRSGKSTTLDSITTALLGINRLTDAKGSGLERDIAYLTGDHWSIRLWGTAGKDGHPWNIHRGKTDSTHKIVFQNGTQDICSLTEAKGAIQSMFGLGSEVLGALLDPDLIVDRPVDQQGIVLRKLLRPQGDIPLPGSVKALGYSTIDSVAGLNNLLKVLEERRTAANAAVKQGVGRIPDEVDEGPVNYELEIKRRLEQRERNSNQRAVLAERVVQASAAQSRVAPEFDQSLYDQLFLDGNSRKLAIDKLQAELAQYHTCLDALRPGPDSKNELAVSLFKHNRELDQAEARLGVARSNLAAFGELGTTCTTCHRKITPSQAKSISDELQSLVDEQDQHRNQWQTSRDNLLSLLNQERERILRETARCEEILGTLTAEQKELRTQLEKLQRQKDLCQAYEQERKTAEAVDLDQLTRELAILDCSLDQLYTEVAELELKQSDWRDRVASNRMRTALLERSDSLQQERSRIEGAYNDLLEVRQQLLTAGAMASFLEGINRFGGDLGLAEVSYDGTELRCEGHELSRLSSGTRMLLELGLRVQAARLTGFNFLMIDDFMHMGEKVRGAVIEKLLASGVQAIIASTTDRPERLVVPKEWEDKIAVFRM